MFGLGRMTELMDEIGWICFYDGMDRRDWFGLLGRMGGIEVIESLDFWVGWMGLIGLGGGWDWFNQTKGSEWWIGEVE